MPSTPLQVLISQRHAISTPLGSAAIVKTARRSSGTSTGGNETLRNLAVGGGNEGWSCPGPVDTVMSPKDWSPSLSGSNKAH